MNYLVSELTQKEIEMSFEIILNSIRIDDKKVDAVYVNHYCYWIPITANPDLETFTRNGYRFLKVNGKEYKFHRSIHEHGRPDNFGLVLEIMKAVSRPI